MLPSVTGDTPFPTEEGTMNFDFAKIIPIGTALAQDDGLIDTVYPRDLQKGLESK